MRWYEKPPVVIARDRKHGYVLLGGLGALNVGQMWFKESDKYAELDGWLDAQEWTIPEAERAQADYWETML